MKTRAKRFVSALLAGVLCLSLLAGCASKKKADDAVIDVHVGAMVEQVQTALDVDFQSRGNMVGFFFLLLKQSVVQVLKDGHILRAGVRKIFAVDQMHTAVNDGFLHRQQPFLAAHHKFAQRKDKVGFQGQGIILLRIVGIDVHGVDELGAVGADFDDLTFQPVHQRRIIGWVSGVTTAFPPKNRT